MYPSPIQGEIMPGFFDIFFRPDEPEPEPVKPKKAKKAKKTKKVEKPDRGEKAKTFVHPLKSKVASLEAELQLLRNPEPQVEVAEPEDDEPAE